MEKPSTVPQRVHAVLARTKGPKVLDIGCSGQAGLRSDLDSPWWLHGALHQHFPDVWGLEFVESNVQALHDAGYEKVVQGDAQNIDLEMTFDTIVAGELIEHLTDPGRFLHSVRKHLNPGGRLVLTTPYAFSLVAVVYAWLKYPRTCSNEEHTLWLCPTTLERLLSMCGFRLVSLDLIEDYRPDLPSKTYRFLLPAFLALRRLIPFRLRGNTMVAVARLR